MKTAFFSLMLLTLCLVCCFARTSNAAPPCGTVDVKAASCITFASGRDGKPSAACCTGLQQLTQAAKTVDDKKAICRCLKAGVKNFAGCLMPQGRRQDKFLSKIPAACNIKLGFPVSLNTDCEKLH